MANTNAVYTLLKKDPKNQKEIEKLLLIFEKKKFEKEINQVKKTKNIKKNIMNFLIKMKK
jgi:hypothetical protein